MNNSICLILLLTVYILLLPAKNFSQEIQSSPDNKEVQLIMRADDIGFSNAANMAIIKAFREGVITSTEVLVPGPWFIAAAKLLRENPGLDVGVHLDLTSEWNNFKWGPITNASGLVTKEGYFPAGNDEFNKLNPDPDEIEKELRAQIEMAKNYIPQVSHLSAHMGTASSTPELAQIVNKLSEEYNLPIEDKDIVSFESPWNEPVEKKESYIINNITNLKPGITVIVFHLALDNDETRGIEGSVFDANVRMAQHRQTETNIVTGNRIKQLIIDKKIKLRSYSGNFKDLTDLK